jgi:predicted O-linked N-acetylglucosamine transferase (SPINDLY family)
LKPSTNAANSFSRALACHQAGDLVQARRGYLEILRSSPRHFDAKHLLGVIAHQQGEHEQAVKLIREALLLSPRIASAHNNLGSALLALGRHDEAKTSFNKALTLEPGYIEARYNLGNVLFALRELEQAVEVFTAVTQALPEHFEAWNNLGNALLDLKRPQEALRALNQAVQVNPLDDIALFNRGNARAALREPLAALQDLNEALALNSTNVEFWRARGDVLRKGLCEYQAAIDAYERGLSLQADHQDTLINKAQAHYLLKQLEQSIICYEQALAATPDDLHILGNLVLARMHLCRWDGFSESLTTLLARLPSFDRHIGPFGLLSLTDSPALQLADTRRFYASHFADLPRAGRPAARSHGGRLRIAYVSEDFYDHPVGRQMVQLLECHDRTRFEIYAISLCPDKQDDIQTRIRCAAEHFMSMGERSDLDVAAILRELQIDIAIDLGGATGNVRNSMFAHGCAPVQASFLGYAGTSGGNFVDYLIADRIVVPQQSRPHYAEQLVYLPDSMMPGDSTRLIATRAFTRSELGLPETGFVFRCYNSLNKILPETFDLWMQILKHVPGSVLWLSTTRQEVIANLRQQATQRGVEATRLVFAEVLPLAEHLARNRCADLFLDTFPYGAHSTGNDALWSGLPVLTRVGQSFASRVCASQLLAIDLPELVVTSTQEYLETAVRLATQPQLLADIRQRLRSARDRSRLFNTPRFARHLESAFNTMHTRACRSLPTIDFDVQALEVENDREIAALPNPQLDQLLAQAESELQRGFRMQALRSFQSALLLAPQDALLRRRVADLYLEFKDFEQASAHYKILVQTDSGSAELMLNYLLSLFYSNRYAEAHEAIKRRGHDPLLPGQALYIQLRACVWDGFELQREELVRRVMQSGETTNPLSLLSIIDAPDVHRIAAQNFSDTVTAGITPTAISSRGLAGRKLRIGYFSPDFGDHAMAYQMAEFYEVTDRDRFEQIGFSLGGHSDDPWRRRLEASFDTFLDVSTMDDAQIAAFAREMQIDIAVDLAGNTAGSRFGIFAHRCAPVQISYLGYPGTSGSPHIDYLVADKTVVPPAAQGHYSEKMLYLPRTFMVNDGTKPAARDLFTREQLGLPATGFVFRCYNNSYKILPDVFSCWMRLLKQVPGSVLWLLDRSTDANDNLRRYATESGIDPERLIFSAPLAVDLHLSRNRIADLFLDTFPYTAHSTGCDALWSGLPVLTRMGESFASRVAGSLLLELELPELVTYSLEEYESKALYLATHPQELAILRERLKRNRSTSVLFDARDFARRIEQAYVMAFDRHLSGQAPDHLDIPG